MSEDGKLANSVRRLQIGTMSEQQEMYVLCSGDMRISVPKAALEKQSGYVRSLRSFRECSNEPEVTEMTETSNSETKHTETRSSETSDTETEHTETTNTETRNSDTTNCVIKLDNLSGEVLQRVAEFVKKGNVTLDMDNVVSTLIGADFLDIPTMVRKCETFVLSQITLDNYQDTLSMAVMYNMDNLTEICCNFVVCNFDRLSKAQYIALSKKQMKKCLGDDKLHVFSELQLLTIVKKWLKHNMGVKHMDYYRDIHIETDVWQTFTGFMCEIRWPLIKQDDRKKIEPGIKHAMKKIPTCRELLTAAKDYQSDISHQSIKQSKLTQVRNEGTSLCLITKHGFNVYNFRTGCIRQILQLVPEDDIFNQRYTVPVIIALDNFLYVCGGTGMWPGRRADVGRECFRYDPRFNTWFELPGMTYVHEDSAIVAHDKNLYIIGGFDHADQWNTRMCECFDILLNKWHDITMLPRGVMDHAACMFSDSIYVSGGITFIDTDEQRPENIDREVWHRLTHSTHSYCTNSLYRYDVYTEQNNWHECSRMIRNRFNHSMKSVGECLYVIGGCYDNFSLIAADDAEQYSPHSDQWTQCIHVPLLAWPASFVSGDQIYVVGGWDTEKVNLVWRSFNVSVEYDYETVDPLKGMPLHRWSNPCTCTISLPYHFWE